MKRVHRPAAGTCAQPDGGKAEKRGSLRGVIKIGLRGVFGEAFFFCTSLNISVTGMLIETEKDLGCGDRIACSFVLQHKTEVTGEVVRIVQKAPGLYHYGIRFLDISPKAKAQIQEWVSGGR